LPRRPDLSTTEEREAKEEGDCRRSSTPPTSTRPRRRRTPRGKGSKEEEGGEVHGGPDAFAAMVPWEFGCDMKERMRRYSRTAHAFVLVAVLAEVERSGRRGKLPTAARRRCKPLAATGRT